MKYFLSTLIIVLFIQHIYSQNKLRYRDDVYLELSDNNDYVFVIPPFFIVNNGGKKICQSLPVSFKIDDVFIIDPNTGQEQLVTDTMHVLDEICFFKGGKTSVYYKSEGSLINIIPENDYDEIFIPLTTGEINILANSGTYDFSLDSIPFEVGIDEMGNYLLSDLVVSRQGKYSVYDLKGKAFIIDADMATFQSEWLIYKNDSIYKVDHQGKYMAADINNEMISNDLYPFNMLAASDTILWKIQKNKPYAKKYFGNPPFKYAWRDRVSNNFNTRIFSTHGKLLTEKDSIVNCDDFYEYYELKSFVTINSDLFGITDFNDQVIIDSLTLFTAWGFHQDSCINATGGTNSYFKIKHTVRYLSAKKGNDFLLIDASNGSVVKKTRKPVKVEVTRESDCNFNYTLLEAIAEDYEKLKDTVYTYPIPEFSYNNWSHYYQLEYKSDSTFIYREFTQDSIIQLEGPIYITPGTIDSTGYNSKFASISDLLTWMGEKYESFQDGDFIMNEYFILDYARKHGKWVSYNAKGEIEATEYIKGKIKD